MNLVRSGIFNPQRNTIYARVDSALRKIRETSEVNQLQLVKITYFIVSSLRIHQLLVVVVVMRRQYKTLHLNTSRHHLASQ